jgi:membrane associated rhomboid family serine protease
MNLIRRPFRYSYGNAVLVLIGINLLVFLAQSAFPAPRATWPSTRERDRGGAYWQFLSYMFAHGGLSHLLVNMLGLFFFGTQVERHIGSKEFLLYYLVTGVLAGLFSFLVYLMTGADYVYLLAPRVPSSRCSWPTRRSFRIR